MNYTEAVLALCEKEQPRSVAAAVLGWFDPEVDGVLEQYSEGEGFPERVAKTILALLPGKANKYLGGGDMGHAWRLDDGSVAKITIDRKEAEAASKLTRDAKDWHPNVGRLMHVRQIGKLPVYLLVQEFAGQKVTDKGVIELLRKVNAITQRPVMMNMMNALEDAQVEGKAKKAAADLAAALGWLMDHDVEFTDLNPGNVVVKDGNYRIIDLGLSEVRQKAPIKAVAIGESLMIPSVPIYRPSWVRIQPLFTGSTGRRTLT